MGGEARRLVWFELAEASEAGVRSLELHAAGEPVGTEWLAALRESVRAGLEQVAAVLAELVEPVLEALRAIVRRLMPLRTELDRWSLAAYGVEWAAVPVRRSRRQALYDRVHRSRGRFVHGRRPGVRR